MATDYKISELTQGTPDDTDWVAYVDISDTTQSPSGTTKKSTKSNLKGDTGAKGDAATVDVGSTTTGNPGTDASVTNSGTTSAAILDFVIPRGDVGAQGPQGIQGLKGDKGDTGDTGPQGIQGIQGVAGADGVGVPTGGTTGQILKKKSNTNYDTEWGTITSGLVGTKEVDETDIGDGKTLVYSSGSGKLVYLSVATALLTVFGGVTVDGFILANGAINGTIT